MLEGQFVLQGWARAAVPQGVFDFLWRQRTCEFEPCSTRVDDPEPLRRFYGSTGEFAYSMKELKALLKGEPVEPKWSEEQGGGA